MLARHPQTARPPRAHRSGRFARARCRAATPFVERRPAAASTTLKRLTGAYRRGTDAQSLKSEQGQTLVEFALILPILLVLVIGVFDFGSAFNSKNDLNFLANTAARYAEVNSCAPCGKGQTIADYVKSTADTSQLNGSLTISFCLPALSGGTANDGSVGNPLQVSASAPFNWFAVNLPGLPTGQLLGGLTSTVTVRILQKSDGTLYTAAACS